MRTEVTIVFNGAVFEYKFDMPRDRFQNQWDNHIAGQGYFSGVDMKDEYILINPLVCPLIEIREIK